MGWILDTEKHARAIQKYDKNIKCKIGEHKQDIDRN